MSGTKVAKPQAAYSKPEELTNVISHAISAALSFVGLVFLLLKASPSVGAVGCVAVAIYGVLLIAAFVTGAVAHALPFGSKARETMSRLDRALPVLPILGILAPVYLFVLSSGGYSDFVWGWVMYCLTAAFAVTSVVFCAANVQKHRLVRLYMYIAMAALLIVRIERIVELGGYVFFWYILGGGVLYAFGIIIGAVNAFAAQSVLSRLFIFGGAALHFVCIYTVLL